MPAEAGPGDADGGAASGEAGSTAIPVTGAKTGTAFRTIGELAADTGLPQHILRYWETRFPQLRPLQRAGNRRYYRAEDVALVRRIDTLLNREGYTVRGVQQLLANEKTAPAATAKAEAGSTGIASPMAMQPESLVPALKAIRALLAQALIADDR